MKAIYASKLYKASSRKENIQSALSDPKNEKLVKQLARYLDEEYVPTTISEGVSSEGISDSSSSGSSPSNPAGTGHSSPHPSGGGYSGGIGDMADIELPGGEDEENLDEGAQGENGADSEIDSPASTTDDESPEVEPEEDTDDVSNTAVENAQSTAGTSVTASIDIQSLPEEIKGTLNARQECAGVNRVMFKDMEELWVYYNDEINLNNVMTAVIELFNAIGYTYLEFNRLARSANAIVFLVNVNDTSNCIKSVEELNDED